MFPKDDNQFEEVAVVEVRQEGHGWAMTREDGFSFFVKEDSPVEPKPGMSARFYGPGIGSRVRGLFLDGTQVFYRTEDEDKDLFEIQTYGADCSELLARWDRGDLVHTIEMGGMGPGYEQCIHITMFEALRYMIANPLDMDRATTDEAYWREYLDALDKEACFSDSSPVAKLGLSGAQHGAAISLAAQFYRKGPRGVMTDPEVKDRHIMVAKKFPG